MARRARGSAPRAKFGAELAEVTIAGERVLLCKPMEFMNVSGQAVARVAGFWKVGRRRTIVVHDELDLPFERLKLGAGGGPRRAQRHPVAHSADSGDPAFARVRVGIGRPAPGRDPARLRAVELLARRGGALPDVDRARRRRGRGDRQRRPHRRDEPLQRQSSERQRRDSGAEVVVVTAPSASLLARGNTGQTSRGRPMSTTGTNPRARARRHGADRARRSQRIGSSRDMAGRKREYETIYILRPDSTSDVIAQVNQKVRGVIEAGGGNLLKIDNWGKRKLAYEVKKQLKGIYLFFSYLGKAGLVEEVERNLRLTDSVIRYYSVKIAENVDPAARPSRVHRGGVHQGRDAGTGRGRDRDRSGRARSPFDEEEGAFDFEEAVFGSVDEPRGRGKKD